MIEKRNLTAISDPGHGWLSVSLKDLKTLDITDKISTYSYMSLSRAYLEEDSDLMVFVKAANDKGWEINIKDSIVESTAIRNYASFSVAKLELALDLKEGTEFNLYNSSSKSWSTKAKVTKIEGSQIYIDCEHGNKYKISKNKFLDRVKPLIQQEAKSTIKSKI